MEPELEWYDERANVAYLAQKFIDSGDESEIPNMIEKPWNYDDMYEEARAEEI